MTHWKKLTNPDYLGAYALEPGQEIVGTIRSVGTELVIGTDGKKEECTVAHFSERGIKPMILNATNCKTITKLSVSQFKAFSRCEAAAMAELRGEYAQRSPTALLVGSYIDAFVSGEMADFTAEEG